jgi:hypothetical protein
MPGRRRPKRLFSAVSNKYGVSHSARTAQLAGKPVPDAQGKRKKRKQAQQQQQAQQLAKAGPVLTEVAPGLFRNTRESLKLIADYHTLNKKLASNATNASLSEEKRVKVQQELLSQQEALGGIDMYQKASMFGAASSQFVCASWVEPILRELVQESKTTPQQQQQQKKKKAKKKKLKKPRILDVGAIDNQYLAYDWFQTVPIDLNSQHASVIKADFFDYAHDCCVQFEDTQDTHYQPFEAVVMSLVLNFQGDPRKRGHMLALAADPRVLKPQGLVFLSLPSASVDNSRYCDVDLLTELVGKLGLTVVDVKHSFKLILMVLKATETADNCFYDIGTKTFTYGTDRQVKRQVVKEGKHNFNNFCVMLKSDATTTTTTTTGSQ